MILSFDTEWGCFGFLHPEWIWYCLIIWFFGAMYPGYFAFIQAMLYLPPQVTSSGLLVEPLLGQLFGVVFGLDRWPGWQSFLGAVIDLVGIYLINKGEQQRQAENQKKKNELKAGETEMTEKKQDGKDVQPNTVA